MNYRVKSDCRGLSFDEIKKIIIEQRKIKDIDHFLHPTEDDILPLTALPNIEKAGRKVQDGIIHKAKFMVYYDVDADGICSGTQMVQYLQKHGIQPTYYINQGKAHGITNVYEIMREKPDILIIVDSLDSNAFAYEELAKEGIDIIILDHHNVREKIPYDKFVTLVTSAKNYPNPFLSGSGVVYKFCLYLDRIFGADFAEPFSDLCAVGLVADMMNVSEDYMENRALIDRGFRNIINPGLKKLKGQYEFDSKTVSFGIAPKVNACMRMNCNDIPVDFFMETRRKELKELMTNMELVRDDQNDMVADLLESMQESLDQQLKENKNLLFFRVYGSNVLGMIGNKLTAKYKKPVIIIGHDPENGYYHGSGRGFGNKSLAEYVEKTNLAHAYGHDNAFGIEIPEDNLEKFIDKLEKSLKDYSSEGYYMEADLHLTPKDINSKLVDFIKSLNRISGQGFPEIKTAVTLDEFSIGFMTNGKHLKVTSNGMLFIIWNFNNPEKLEQLETAELFEEPVTFIGTLDKGYIGRTFSFKMICDDFFVG